MDNEGSLPEGTKPLDSVDVIAPAETPTPLSPAEEQPTHTTTPDTKHHDAIDSASLVAPREVIAQESQQTDIEDEASAEQEESHHSFSFQVDTTRLPEIPETAPAEFRTHMQDVIADTEIAVSVDGNTTRIENTGNTQLAVFDQSTGDYWIIGTNGLSKAELTHGSEGYTISEELEHDTPVLTLGNQIGNYHIHPYREGDDQPLAMPINMYRMFHAADTELPYGNTNLNVSKRAHKEMDPDLEAYATNHIRLELNRARRSQVAFMRQAGIPESYIDAYDTDWDNIQITMSHKTHDDALYDHANKTVHVYRPETIHDMAYEAHMMEKVPHEMTHYGKANNMDNIQKTIRPHLPFFKKLSLTRARHMDEGFTELTTHIMDGNNVFEEDYNFSAYEDESALARDIYKEVLDTSGEQQANQMISYFNMGEFAMFLDTLEKGLQHTDAKQTASYLATKFAAY